MRIYISCTTEDLGEMRSAVARQVRSLGNEPIFMEEYSASSMPPVKKCLQDVADADVYLGLFAFRYGYVPPDMHQSVTELEYRQAVACEIPTLIFMVPDDVEWYVPYVDRGKDGLSMLSLRDELMRQVGHTVRFFRNQRELLERVPQALQELASAERPTKSQKIDGPQEDIVVNLNFRETRHFKNRENEIRQLTQLLVEENVKCVVVAGQGGTGKTTLVSEFCRRVQVGEVRFNKHDGKMGVNGIVYFDCRGAGKGAIERLVHDLIQLLDADAAAKTTEVFADESRSEEEKYRVLLAHFQQGKYLLAFDAMEDLLASEHYIDDPALRRFFDVCLTSPHGLQVLGTSSETVLADPAARVNLRSIVLDHGLPEQDAVTLLRELDDDGQAGLRESSDTLLHQLAAKCHFVPRALISVVSMLTNDPTLTVPELIGNDAHFTDLEAEEYRRISTWEERLRVFEIIVVFDCATTRDAVHQVATKLFPRIDANRCLLDLVYGHSVTFSRSTGTYEIQPPLQKYAYAQMEQQSGGLRRVNCHRAVADYYAQQSTAQDTWRTLSDVQPQIAQIRHRLLAGEYELAATLTDEIGKNYLQVWGNYRTIISLREMLGEKLPQDSELNQSNFGNLGIAYRNLGNGEQAIACFERAVTYAEASNDPRGLSEWYCELGNAFADRVEVPTAVEKYHRAIDCAKQCQDLAGESRALGNLAIAHRVVGEFETAKQTYERALAIDDAILDDPSSQGASRQAACRQRAIHLGNLGKCYRALDQPDRAIECAVEASNECRRLDHTLGMAVFHSHIGEVLLSRRKYDEAIENLEASIEMLRETGISRSTSHMFESLGKAYHHGGELERAEASYQQALDLDVPETAYDCHAFLGLISLERGDTESARQCFSQSITAARELLDKSPRYYGCLYRLTLAYLAGGNGPQAIDTCKQALATCSSSGVADAALHDLQLLDRCHVSDKKTLDEVRQMLETARAADT